MYFTARILRDSNESGRIPQGFCSINCIRKLFEVFPDITIFSYLYALIVLNIKIDLNVLIEVVKDGIRFPIGNAENECPVEYIIDFR